MLVTCNNTKKTDHCKFECLHGDVHEADTGMDSCKIIEHCDIAGKKVKCRPLYIREKKLL